MLRTALVILGAAAIACHAMAQPIGVPVCDALLERLEACADKLPEGLQDDCGRSTRTSDSFSAI